VSSSVSYAYRVQEEELRRRRELASALDALRAASARYARVRDRAAEHQRAWGEAISLPRLLREDQAGTDAARVRISAGELEREAAAAERRLQEEVVDARVAALREGLALAGAGGGSAPIGAEVLVGRARRGHAAPTGETSDGGDAVEETLVRLLSRLDGDAGEAAVGEIEAVAELARDSRSTSGRDQAVDSLRLLVQRANGAARAKRERERTLDAQEARLHGFDGPEAGALRRLIAALRGDAATVPDDLDQRVGSAIELEGRAQEAGYVASELQRALDDLGYELGPDFETVLVDQGFTEFSRPEWSGYAVRVRVGGRPPYLDFDVVRGESDRIDQASRDLEVETEFCDGQGAVLAKLEQGGIHADRTRVVVPGERPIEIRAAGEADQGREDARQVARERRR
jgi:hypothetical protein